MFSDDVYRNRLSSVIETLDAWAREQADVAVTTTNINASFWKLSVSPFAPGACPFELMLRADQRFNLQIGREVYEDKPVDTFEFFPMLVRAIGSGNVERIEVSSALTAALEAIETRVTLEDGWAWIGERRVGPRGMRRTETVLEQRAHRFLPYRR
jgi:hypothetical protein